MDLKRSLSLRLDSSHAKLGARKANSPKPLSSKNSFGEQPRGRSLAFISTFWPGGSGVLSAFTLAEELSRVGFSPVIVVTSDRLVQFERITGKVRDLGIDTSRFFLFQRPNLGRDFGSHKEGFAHFRDSISQAERVFLGNDGLVGPLFTSEYFSNLQNLREGLYSPTESFDKRYHLQSSHLLFAGSELVKDAQRFFDSYPLYRNRENIIRHGEIGLTNWFLERGRRVTPLYETANLFLATPSPAQQMFELTCNHQHFFYDALLLAGFPFVKRELLLVNPLRMPAIYEKVVKIMTERNAAAELLFRHLRPI
jgi:lipopolysaccharide biosynthesis protein